MTAAPGILVVTSCTSLKAPTARSGSVAAEDLYTGQQHLRLMRGVRAYRRAGSPWGPLDLRILSACHGLVDARTELTGYDESFTGLSREAIKVRADALGIPSAIAAAPESGRGVWRSSCLATPTSRPHESQIGSRFGGQWLL